MMGYINSIETMGLVDGPGIRFVVFLQGCFLRCSFCHNPETWAKKSNLRMTPQELIEQILRYRPYFKETGGVTFSGGEPLFQPEFLLACLKLCKQYNIHTCLDTAGVGNGNYEEILNYTDLVMMDIKALDAKTYHDMTGIDMNESLHFLEICQLLHKKMWIRQVIIPGMNDNESYIQKLKAFLSNLEGIEKVELLPYETLGVPKYQQMGMSYRLKDIPPMDSKRCEELYQLLEPESFR